ncbi:MAG: hypothetical protein JO132_09700 [Streptosporangiaceae bacterium]|nr:hypothetical protein [Streptosporangiaceae bacterium]
MTDMTPEQAQVPAAPLGDELPPAPVGEELPTAPVGEQRGEERKEQSAPRMPRLPIPGMPMPMPTGRAGRMLWWGGLAALAVFDIVEWPVALLVGAGSWVAEQYAKADERAERQREASEHMPFPG